MIDIRLRPGGRVQHPQLVLRTDAPIELSTISVTRLRPKAHGMEPPNDPITRTARTIIAWIDWDIILPYHEDVAQSVDDIGDGKLPAHRVSFSSE